MGLAGASTGRSTLRRFPPVACGLACAESVASFFHIPTPPSKASTSRGAGVSLSTRRAPRSACSGSSLHQDNKLETLHLRPCEHQVAGHLFEDGKAGSLVDDRGHFYKPLQRGPRGDRERAFYDTVEALLRAERAADELHLGSPSPTSNGRARGSSGGSGGGAAVATTADGSPPPALPWQTRRLRQLFPSFKDAQRDQLPMSITQRDELGLLPSASLGSDSVDPLADLISSSRQAGVQQLPLPPQPQQQPRQEEAGCCEWAHGQGQVYGAKEGEEQLVLQLSKSPDSDDCAEHTGRHLMQTLQQQQQPEHAEHGRYASSLPTSSTGGSSCRAAAASGWHVRAASPSQQEAAAEPVPEAQGGSSRQEPSAAAAGSEAAGVGLPQWVPPPRHATAVEEAYTLPEHAQAAALLGQPVYDRSLSIGSSSKPARSPFMSALLHHCHPPGPQEVNLVPAAAAAGAGGAAAAAGVGAAAVEGAAVEGAAVGRAGADGSSQGPALQQQHSHQQQYQAAQPQLAPSGSCAADWLSDVDELDPDWQDQQQQELHNNQQLHQQQQKGQWGRNDSGSRAPSSPRGDAYTRLPFSVRNAPLLRVIPKYYGVAAHPDGRVLLELEDLARAYRHPCIMDVKVGFKTWYPQADPRYIQRCREKDESTTQSALGFKVCGMQVFRHGAGGYWRASKRWCKTLPVELVDKALLSFAHNEHGLRPADVYGGAAGAIAQLEALEAWFSVQRDFHFYSSSVLLLYEGDARCQEEAKVRVRLVDFAHTFYQFPDPCQPGTADGEHPDGQQQGAAGPDGKHTSRLWPHTTDCEGSIRGGRDTNFLAGLRALLVQLRGVVHASLEQELA